jgi:very-short-patch-repair endonuclease
MVGEHQHFARKLRRQATKPEDILWTLLRGRRFSGVKFRRQVPLLGYTVDFLSFERRLVIELMGASMMFSAITTPSAATRSSAMASCSSASAMRTC